MVGVDRFYLFGMEVREFKGEFFQAVQKSGQDCAEDTGSVGTEFSDTPQLLSFLPEYPKFHPSLRGPSNSQYYMHYLFIYHY